MKQPLWVKIFLNISVLVFLVLKFSCGSVSGGSGSSTTNGISAIIYDNTGNIVKNALVRLRPSNYLAGDIDKKHLCQDEFTNEDGSFLLHPVDTGNYTIEIVDSLKGVLILRCKIDFKNDFINFGKQYLSPGGILHGNISDTFVSGSEVKIYGLERNASITNKEFVFENVASGKYDITIDDNISQMKTIPLLSNVSVYSQESTSVYLRQNVGQGRRIYINTSGSDLGSEQHLRNFPLLLRLDETNFDFSVISSNAPDFEFFNKSGKYLPFEIELWDQSNKYASIWVLLDTILGGSKNSYIDMYLGKNTKDISRSGKSVFDTSDGYCGMYHLSNTSDSLVVDATILRNNAFQMGIMPNIVLNEGISGKCFKFDGVDDWLFTSENRPITLPGDVTISAWVKTRALKDQGIVTIAGVDGKEGRRIRFMINDEGYFRFALRDSVPAYDSLDWANAVTPNFIADGDWHYLVVVFVQGKEAQAYFDGNLCATLDISSIPITTFNLVSIKIGYDDFRSNSFFDGLIDEVSVVSGVWNPLRIKLMYLNQKPGSMFFEK